MSVYRSDPKVRNWREAEVRKVSLSPRWSADVAISATRLG